MTRGRICLLYLGRRGGGAKITEQFYATMRRMNTDATFVINDGHELADRFAVDDPTVLRIAFPSEAKQVALFPHQIHTARKQIADFLSQNNVTKVVELMPHVWSPFVYGAIKSTGVEYTQIIHDAERHPGDLWSLGNLLSNSLIDKVDRLICLSEQVGLRLEERYSQARGKTHVLFHPNLEFGTIKLKRRRAPSRVMFLGRIQRYKGLPVFLEAVHLLRQKGIEIEAGIFGRGELSNLSDNLNSIDAKIINRWLSDEEICIKLAEYDLVALPYIEASQSGVVAAAHGAGLPVVVTPVGGLIEQVAHRKTGVIAQSIAPSDFACAMEIALNEDLYTQMRSEIADRLGDRSMERFILELWKII